MARAFSCSTPTSGLPSSESSSTAATPPACKRAQHGQRVHALDHVVAGRLAQLLVGGRDVEQVVGDLEHHAERLAVLGERVDERAVERSATMPPMRAAVENSDAVLPLMLDR
jgi:hypothetical protein